jgi:hypothetical protein
LRTRRPSEALEDTEALAAVVAVAEAVELVVAEITGPAVVVVMEEEEAASDLREALPTAALRLLMAEAAMEEEVTVAEAVEAALRAGGKASCNAPIISTPFVSLICTLSRHVLPPLSDLPHFRSVQKQKTLNLKNMTSFIPLSLSTTRNPADYYIRPVIVVDGLHYLSRPGPNPDYWAPFLRELILSRLSLDPT